MTDAFAIDLLMQFLEVGKKTQKDIALMYGADSREFHSNEVLAEAVVVAINALKERKERRKALQ